MASSFLYQPSPRFWHCAAQIGEKAYLWGGRTQDFSTRGRKTLASELNTFDAFSETWNTRVTTGVPPPGLYDGGCTVIDNSLYYFGGRDGYSYYNSLHCNNSITAEWKELSSQNPVNQPMPKAVFGIVSYTDTASLAIFAGFGIPHGPTQAGARFVQSSKYPKYGWSNEFHLFNVANGEWSSPPTTGPRPPPCSSFSFTAINHHMAVMFGGRQPEHGYINDVYIIDFQSMEWTKLERSEGAPWPVERARHAACCLNYGDDEPQLLVTGGVDKKRNTLSDAWLLDINTGRWRELTLPEGTQPQYGHTVTSFQLDEDRVHATTFGGCPEYDPNRSLDDDLKLADTTVMEFESVQSSSSGTPTSKWVLMSVISTRGLGTPERLKKLEEIQQRKTEHESIESPPSNDGSPTCEWALVGVIRGNQMRSEARKAELEKIEQRKTEHEKEREIQELKEKVQQLEGEVALAQRQSRLSLARAVRAEIEADKVPVLEQELQQTKANLEGQKDQARIEAEQQLQQTKTALEHQIHMKDLAGQQLREAMASLQHEIQLRDRTISTLHQQIHQMEATLKHQTEVNKQAIASAQKQFNHHMKTLEHQMKARAHALEIQIQAKDRKKVELEQQLCKKEEQIQATDREKAELEQQLHQKEEQIQATDREKAELEQQLHQKEEQIHSKDREKAELEQQLCQRKEHGPPQVTQVADMQQEGSVHATAQGEISSVHELLQSKEQVRKKEEELRQVKEEHEAELSRLAHKNTAKQHEIEFELKAQLLQADALQDDLQQQLNAKDIQLTAISRESQHNQGRIDTLTDENKEMTAQINSLETKLLKLEFLEGVSSQEIDQLREELMDKEVEIDYLRKEQAYTTPTTTAISSPLSYLRGAEVVAETTFTLTPEQQSFEFTGYGFKLHVPKGSLPAKVSETQLNVQVSLSGQFQMPPTCELVSAVYWVSSPHKFTKPLDVEIQHCAALSSHKQCEQLMFVHTKCTQKELPYTFTELEKGVFGPHSSYGTLSLSHFSGLGIVFRKLRRPHRVHPGPLTSVQTIQVQPPALGQITDQASFTHSEGAMVNTEGTEQNKIFDQYCGQVYTKKGVNDCRVYFVITRNLDAHRTVVKKFCCLELLAKEYMEMSLKFVEDEISLAVPRGGVTLKSGWKIIPLHSPVIRKANVDHFGRGQAIPKCELLLRWPHRDKPHVCLVHDIDITGAQGCSYFTLYIPDAAEDTPTLSPVAADSGLFSPNSGSTTASSPRGLGSKYSGLESEPEMSDLMNEVASKVPAKWKQISIQLGLTPSDQECFMASTPNDPLQCFTSVFRVWKSRATRLYTWSTVIEALESPAVDEMRLAQELRMKLQSNTN